MRGPHLILPLSHQALLPGMLLRLPLVRLADIAAVETHVASGAPLLAVPTLHPDLAEVQPEDLVEVGCGAVVRRLVRLGDGTVRVLIEGTHRAKLKAPRFDPEHGLVGVARPVTDKVRSAEKVALLFDRLGSELNVFTSADPANPPPLARLSGLDVGPGRLADRVAALLTIPMIDQVAFLAERVVDERLESALEGLARERELRSLKLKVDKKVQDTMDRQQREYYLREQIRGLRAELSDAPATYDEAAELEKKLRECGLPEPGLTEALRELERLRRMHSDAAEYTVLRNWLDWLTAMPWSEASEDNEDLHRAQQALDAQHYGLDKAKDRILEYLAVRTLNPTGQGPVLCFVGPPGVGKTSLGRSVAEALGRQFQRISLGGMKDEAEIRGHRRTYVGALPGRIAHALKKAGTKNPVIVLDEIDKLGKDFRGDPAAALLEVLDPEQNDAFVDHYLDVPVDLSQVLFICTANLADPIPEALVDRLELISIPGYLLEEKLKIARHHLLQRLQESHGLSDHGFSVTQNAVQHVIESHTREAGVRQLQQKLAALHRKAARQFVEGRKRGMRVHRPDQVDRLLGPPKHFVDLVESTPVPGVITGLAWTAAGGDILFIEATSWVDDKPSLQLTGQLGQVMQESAKAALSLVKTRTEALQIDPSAWKTRAIHIHVPSGAVPKDGPSAGVTMVTALVSLLTGRAVRGDLAMSGEITLRGKVLPVGGVKEKVLAARRAGATEVMLPARNENDLVDIPPALRRDLRFHFVERVDQVLAVAFPEP